MPLPLIIGGLMIGGAIYALSQGDSDEATEFKNKKICPTHQKFFKKKANKKNVKTHSTKSINKLIELSESFKIGKSGDLKGRSISSDYRDYDCLFPITESTDKDLIKQLEKEYNKKYKKHSKNNNLNEGSAGEMTDSLGRYILYLALNRKKK